MTKLENSIQLYPSSKINHINVYDSANILCRVLKEDGTDIKYNNESLIIPDNKKELLMSLLEEDTSYAICEIFKIENHKYIFWSLIKKMNGNDVLHYLQFNHIDQLDYNEYININWLVISKKKFKTHILIELDIWHGQSIHIIYPYIEGANIPSQSNFLKCVIKIIENKDNIRNNWYDFVCISAQSTSQWFSGFTKNNLSQNNITDRFRRRNIDLQWSEKEILIKRWFIENKVYEFFDINGYVKIDSPKITTTWDWGNVKCFTLDYYGNRVNLNINNYFYHLLSMWWWFDKIYELSTVFRQDDTKTWKHLSEFMALDFNLLDADLNKLISIWNNFLTYLDSNLSKHTPWYINKIPSHINTITYDEYFSFLNDFWLDVNVGDVHKIPEIKPEKIAEKFGKIFRIINKPAELDAFYNKKSSVDWKKSENCELYAVGIWTLADGGERENDKNKLAHNLIMKWFDIDKFNDFINICNDGVPNFWWIWFGFDRLVAFFLDINNIRNTKLMYRDTKPPTL